jgi:hypothetical protein
MKSDRKLLLKMYQIFSNTDLREKIKNIKCPTLVLLRNILKNVKPAIEEQYKNLKHSQPVIFQQRTAFIMYDDKNGILAS